MKTSGGGGGGGGGGIKVVGSDFPLASSIYALVTVGNIEEKVLFMVLLKREGEHIQYNISLMERKQSFKVLGGEQL